MIKFSLKPFFACGVFKNKWLTESKDFSISSVIQNPFIFKLSDVKEGRNSLSLPANTLEISLVLTFNK